MKYTIIRPADHEGWLEERKKGIGSSEAGTIMGVNKWDTPYQLWARKTGKLPPVEMNETMELGHYLEDTVAQIFAQKTGNIVDNDSAGDWLAVSDTKDYLRVSPDRLYRTPDEDPEGGFNHIVEIKTTSLPVDPDNPPLYWYYQLMYQMGVMGLKSGCIAWLSTSPKFHFGYTEVQFNEYIYNLLEQRIDSFWNVNILQDIAPEEETSDDILLKYPTSKEEKKVIATAAMMKKIDSLANLKKSITSMKSQEDELCKDIKAQMKDAETIITKDGKLLVSWKTMKDSVSFNEAAFKESNPEEWKKWCVTKKGTRKFIVK